MGNVMDPSSGMGGGEFGQMGDPTQYLTPNDLISQRSSPDFMPGGTAITIFLDFSGLKNYHLNKLFRPTSLKNCND